MTYKSMFSIHEDCGHVVDWENVLIVDPTKTKPETLAVGLTGFRNGLEALEVIYGTILDEAMNKNQKGTVHQVKSPIAALVNHLRTQHEDMDDLQLADVVDQSVLAMANLLVVVLNEVREGLSIVARMQGSG